MSASIPLSRLLSAFSAHPEISSNLSIDGCITFIELIQLLKPTLLLYQPPGTLEHFPLTELPINVLEFLKRCLNIEHEIAKIIWEVLCPIAWRLDIPAGHKQVFGQRYLQFFLDHGEPLGLGKSLCVIILSKSSLSTLAFHDFLPPVRICLDPGCNSKSRVVSQEDGTPYSRELAEAVTVPVTVFTRDFGPIPGLSTSFYCRSKYIFIRIE